MFPFERFLQGEVLSTTNILYYVDSYFIKAVG